MIGVLIFGTIADLLLAVVLITVSGFIFGGPHGISGDPAALAMWLLGLAASLAAPFGGFALRRYGKAGMGAVLTWLPPLVGLLLSFGWPGA